MVTASSLLDCFDEQLVTIAAMVMHEKNALNMIFFANYAYKVPM
jgi:hypothetical protein